ncbi:MAG TPA: Rid family detoxifying hydrolase [Solirubrobacteraceae bacterium]|jgi:2-iminobutanoate/2-iminopropanoate deaminase|nr:Rid family detoxifying hydrolase [Solirubrobacteraceae bacterium]
MSHHRETVNAVGGPPAAGPYSHAVKAAGLVFLSGQTPLDPDTGALVEGDIGAQTARCLDNLAIVAAAAGASLQDAVRCGIYVTDMSTFKAVNEAYATYFGDAPPARSTIGVAALPLGADVEIDAILAIPEG